MRSHLAQVRNGSVSQDWIRPLGEEKSRAYLECLRTLETNYGMFSVNLDEALSLQHYGRAATAYQVLSVAPALCRRLAVPLHSLLCTMLEHAKHFGTTPNVLPLAAQNFQNPKSQRAARFNDLLSRVLLTRRSQFLLKMSALADLVEELHLCYEGTVVELCAEESLLPEKDWEKLDSVHYDLNTCLREAVVLLKSFLHALPDIELEQFEANLWARAAESYEAATVPLGHLAHRRIAFLKGQ